MAEFKASVDRMLCVPTKHLRIQNETKQNKTKLIYHFDFGQPKQNKILNFLILVNQN